MHYLILSEETTDPLGRSSLRNRNILLDMFCLRSFISNFILSEYNILSACNGRMIKMLVQAVLSFQESVIIINSLMR